MRITNEKRLAVMMQKESAAMYEHAQYWTLRQWNGDERKRVGFESFFRANAIEYQERAAKLAAETRQLMGIE